MHSILRLFTSALVLATAALQAQTPPRSLAGQTLEVPEEQLERGMVYYLYPGEDAQIVVRNQASQQQAVLTTTRAVGYVVSPFDLEEESAPILAGAFRIPSASIRTGSQSLDQLIQSGALLDSANHPEIAFRVDKLDQVRQVSSSPQSILYTAQMSGTLGFKGSEKGVSLPVNLEFRPFLSFPTREPRVGDQMILTAQARLEFDELEWNLPSPAFRPRLADQFPFEIHFTFSNVSPDKSGDPRDEPALYARQLRFVTLLRDLDDPVQGYALGRELMKELWDNAGGLNDLASNIAQTEGIRTNWAFALRAASRAVELSEEKDASMLATLSQIHYEMGDLEAAVESQRKALALVEGTRRAGGFQAALDRYLAELPGS